MRTKKGKVKPLRYFYYNGDLCKKIHISRPDDLVTAWNYPKGKAEKYVYSDVRRNGGQAFSTRQVEGLLNRSRKRIKNAISEGHIRKPQRTYGLDADRNGYAYYWSEKDIIEAWEYFKTVHFGRPRADGRITPKDLPTIHELRGLIRQGTVFYVRDGQGNFIPSWRADNL